MYALIIDNKIEKISFVGEGCSIAIASASLLTEEFANSPISRVLGYSENELLSLLGIPLTVNRQNCALLSLQAFKAALA